MGQYSDTLKLSTRDNRLIDKSIVVNELIHKDSASGETDWCIKDVTRANELIRNDRVLNTTK